MPQNKKHHYVPRFYLRRFSFDGKSINIWNLKKKQRIYSANLKNQCYRDYFYGKQPDLEGALGGIESAAASAMKKAEEFEVLPLPMTHDHLALILYLLTQFGRTTFSASAINEVLDKLMKHLLREEAMAKGIDIEKFAIQAKNAVQLALRAYIQGYPLLLDLGYKLLVNKTGTEFVTSDNPVVFYNQFLSFRPLGGNAGLAQKGLLIFFPIGPKHVLLFYDSGVYSVGKRNNHTIPVIRPQDVYEINTLQICSALVNVYYRDKDIDIDALHRKGSRFRRGKTSNLYISSEQPKGDTMKELIAFSFEDIRTNLSLSILRLRKKAKFLRRRLQKSNTQLPLVPRNPDQLHMYRVFTEKVKLGKYQPGDFFRYLEDIDT